MFNSLRERIRTFWQQRVKAALPDRIKTPTVLQMEAVECGAACLGIVLRHFGRYVPLEELRVSCGVSRDGSKASNIVKAARQYGLKVRVFATDAEAVRKLQPPMIVHWNFNHFVVVDGFKGDKVYLNDPAFGPRRITFEEFDQAFTGIVAMLEPGDGFERGGQKTSIVSGLRQRLESSEVGLLFVVLVSLLLILPGFVVPAFSRIFVDYYLIDGRTQWVGPLIIGMVVTALLRMLLTWLQQYYLLRLETKMAIVSSGQLFWQLLHLPIQFFSQRSAGDISSRVGMNDRVAQLLSGELATTILNAVLVIFYAALMLRYSVLLTVVGMLVAVANVGVLLFVSRKRRDASRRLVQDRMKVFAASFSGLQNIETIKATGAETNYFAQWAGYQANLINATQTFGLTTQTLSAIPPYLTTVANILILTIGGFQVMQGDMTVGMLVAFQTLLIGFLTPVNKLIDAGGQLQEVEGILDRLDDVFNYPTDAGVKLVEEEGSETHDKLAGAITLRNVTFGYSPLEKPLIKDFNLTLQPGSRVALVGGSGSGKSTIAKLVAGLEQPWSGEILFDGQPREAHPRSVMNSSLSMVNQEVYLFAGTIRDNLTMWDDHIPQSDVINAAQDAHIHMEISSRKAGYQSLVSESGNNFSGGQRQRMEIARSLVTNPTMLILDEATSALDTVTEQIIDNNMRRRGSTCLIVAHRLSTIRDCDEIIVLDAGRVVQRGTHEEMWRAGGPYADLIRSGSQQSAFVLDSIYDSLLDGRV